MGSLIIIYSENVQRNNNIRTHSGAFTGVLIVAPPWRAWIQTSPEFGAWHI